MIEASRHGYFNAYSIARAHAAIGNADAAFEWLDRAVTQRTNWIVFMGTQAELAPLRADPRWRALRTRMGTP